MNVTLNSEPTTVDLNEVPVGWCVRPSSHKSITPVLYMRINDDIDCRYELVRLNDGKLFTIDNLDGGMWELADAEMVVK